MRFLVILLLAALPLNASAMDFGSGKDRVTLDINETLLFDWNSQLDDALLDPNPRDVLDLRNRLEFRLRWAKLAAGIRLDAALFPNPPLLGDGSTLYKNDLRVEELFVNYKWGKLKLTLGDDYVALGRGMALSLRKVDDLGFAMSLRGLHLQWRNKRLKLRVTSGYTNVVNVDGVEEKLIPDPHDFIVGTRLEVKAAKWLRIAGHFVDIERRFSPFSLETNDALGSLMSASDQDISFLNPKPVRSMVAGASLEVPDVAGKLSAYLEGNYLTNTKWVNATNADNANIVRQDNDSGYAIYGSMSGYFGPVTMLAEAKHYRDYKINASPHPSTYGVPGLTQVSELQYIAAPTLERIDQRWQENANVTAGHLKVDYRLPEGKNRLFLSGAFFQDAPTTDEYTIHTYGGWEHKTDDGSRYILQAGFRTEEAPLQPLATRLRMLHADFDCYVSLGGNHDLQFHLNHEFRTVNPGSGVELEDDYLEGTTYLSWNMAPHWSFTMQFEYLTNKMNCGNDGCSGDPWWYPGAFVVYKINQSSFVRIFGGKGKGGLKCSGGVCRVFPDFEGVKLDTTLRF
jgi:hypothetical protein